MQEFKKEELFSLNEAAKWCNLSSKAFYMHYRRGHIKAEPLLCHQLYFSRAEIDNFRANYRPLQQQ